MGILKMNTARKEDANLVRNTLEGDSDAFQALVERYEVRLFAMVRHYTRNTMEIEDIVQDTFLKAYRRLDSFDHRSSFYTWIYRIATNTVLDVLKRRGRSPVQAAPDPELLAEVAPCDVPSPSRDIEASELREITHEVLTHLPDIFRTTLIMREFDEMTYQEIADTLGISIGTVESRLFRARARFKDKLLSLYPEFGDQ
ncbi:MAG TPA: sigma-70 family RNA polymerase sigma factor [Planctomycetes bacterium]|jgi:RNA polymerase sigma-70 factor (ECF subfamily)|nr:sigma-70 family RNA polymerase sigma factor [Planctomycetota bacterium]HIL52360.1 sigma-70 family RNA polymerase sigma factor [Planctomycetota bacterium]